MAKIVLIGKHSEHTTWPLALSLKTQQHQVSFITSKGHRIEDASGVDILGYFKKWSLFEAMRFLPTLMKMKPQIFHLILEKDEPVAAEIFLSYMAKSIPGCVVTTSLMDLGQGVRKNPWLKNLVEISDIVTFPSVETLGHLRGLSIQNKRQNRGLLPPMLNLSVPAKKRRSDSVSEMVTWLSQKPTLALPMILTPGLTNPKVNQLLEKLGSKYHILFVGGWESWSVRERKEVSILLNKMKIDWTLSETNDSRQTQKLLRSCEALWLAGLSLTPTDYTRFVSNSWEAHASLVIDSSQASMHSGLWQDTVNVHIVKAQNWKTDLDKLIHKKSLKTPSVLAVQTSRDLIDHSTNDLNRLYNKALSEKAVS